jgi:hypothetical protein
LGSTAYVDAKNSAHTGNVILAPFTAIVLLKGEGGANFPGDAQLIENGMYTIESVTANQRLLSRALESYHTKMVNPGDYDDQKWFFNHLGANVYTIKNKGNSRYLEVPYAKCENNEQVGTYTNATGNHQKWKVVKNGDGIYGLQPNHCLEQGLDRNNGTINTNVIIYLYGVNNENQKWKIVSTIANPTASTLALKVFPNPAQEFIKLTGISVGDNLKIRNMSGVVIKEVQVTIPEEHISLDNLKSGMYIITVSDKESLPFFKQ